MTWAQANPSLGVVRQDGSGIRLVALELEAGALPLSGGDREFMGIAEVADVGVVHADRRRDVEQMRGFSVRTWRCDRFRRGRGAF